jgi:hypothetical protein
MCRGCNLLHFNSIQRGSKMKQSSYEQRYDMHMPEPTSIHIPAMVHGVARLPQKESE